MAVYLPYILLFLLTLFVGILELCNLRKDQMKYVKGLLLVGLVLFIGLRYQTGADWEMYLMAFRRMPAEGNLYDWELGYYWFSNLIYYLTHRYIVLQCLVTIFLLFALCKLYKKYSDYPMVMLTLFLPLFFESIVMAQIRQSIALSIVLLGTPYLIERKDLKFLLVVVVACFFHISAVLTLFFYFMTKKWNKIVCMVLILLFQLILLKPTIVQEGMMLLASWFPGRLGELLNAYVYSRFFQPVPFGSGLYYMAQLFLSLLVLWIYEPKRPADNFILNALVMTVLVQTLSTTVNILGRFQVYFQVYGLMAFSALLTIKIKGIHPSLSKSIAYVLIFSMFWFPKLKMITDTSINKIFNLPENEDFIPYRNVMAQPAKKEDADKNYFY